MAAVLLMVGKQLEHPDVVQKLLDIDQHPCKPQYNYASEVSVIAGADANFWLYVRRCTSVGKQVH